MYLDFQSQVPITGLSHQSSPTINFPSPALISYHDELLIIQSTGDDKTSLSFLYRCDPVAQDNFVGSTPDNDNKLSPSGLYNALSFHPRIYIHTHTLRAMLAASRFARPIVPYYRLSRSHTLSPWHFYTRLRACVFRIMADRVWRGPR